MQISRYFVLLVFLHASIYSGLVPNTSTTHSDSPLFITWKQSPVAPLIESTESLTHSDCCLSLCETRVKVTPDTQVERSSKLLGAVAITSTFFGFGLGSFVRIDRLEGAGSSDYIENLIGWAQNNGFKTVLMDTKAVSKMTSSGGSPVFVSDELMKQKGFSKRGHDNTWVYVIGQNKCKKD